MHRFIYRNEEMLIENFELVDYYDNIDKLVEDAKPRRMSLIGSMTGNCDVASIFEFGSVKKIVVYSDDTGIRGLELNLTNDSTNSYGSSPQAATMEAKEFHFEHGMQLLGIYGKIAYEPGNVGGDTLFTLGFFRDECSDTMQLFMSKKTQHEFIAKEAEKALGNVEKKKAGQDIDVIEMFSVAIVLIIFLTLIICCRTYFKKSKQETQSKQEGPRISIHNVDTTISPK